MYSIISKSGLMGPSMNMTKFLSLVLAAMALNFVAKAEECRDTKNGPELIHIYQQARSAKTTAENNVLIDNITKFLAESNRTCSERATSLGLRARAYKSLENGEEALKDFKELKELDFEEGLALRQLLLSITSLELKVGDLDVAAANFDQAIAEGVPPNKEHYLGLVMKFIEHKQFEDAIRYASAALDYAEETGATIPENYNALIWAYSANDQHDLAEQTAKRQVGYMVKQLEETLNDFINDADQYTDPKLQKWAYAKIILGLTEMNQTAKAKALLSEARDKYGSSFNPEDWGDSNWQDLKSLKEKLDVQMPEFRKNPVVEFPKAALDSGKVGTCEVRFNISKSGKPSEVSAECSDSIFDDAAISAVKKAKFEKTIQNGKAVKVYNLLLPIEFN